MDLDTVADELYLASPDDFVGQRNRLVAEARAAGDRALAREVGQLRRPTRAGWLVNLLAQTESEQITTLLALGPALADAQQRRSGEDLRRLSRERRLAVDGLAARAVALGAEHGYRAPDGAVQEIAQTLQAALGDPAVAELVRRGRLTQTTTWAGFGPVDLTAGPIDPGAESPRPAAADGPDADADEDRPGTDPEAERRATETRERWEGLRTELGEAETDAEEATAHADELAEQVESLRVQLRATEEVEAAARERARATRRRAAELRTTATDAERAAEAAARIGRADWFSAR